MRQEEACPARRVANRGTLNTGWYGIGSPLSTIMPMTAVERRERIVVS